MIERIEIDQETGSTAGRMLAMLEAPFGYGQPVAFQGAVEFIADDDGGQGRSPLPLIRRFAGCRRLERCGRSASAARTA